MADRYHTTAPDITPLFPFKPPKYWMEAKLRAGISAAGAGRIWYHTYDAQRQFIAWMAAPPEEWEAHHLHKP
jgi:hypothetical protein